MLPDPLNHVYRHLRVHPCCCLYQVWLVSVMLKCSISQFFKFIISKLYHYIRLIKRDYLNLTWSWHKIVAFLLHEIIYIEKKPFQIAFNLKLPSLLYLNKKIKIIKAWRIWIITYTCLKVTGIKKIFQLNIYNNIKFKKYSRKYATCTNELKHDTN